MISSNTDNNNKEIKFVRVGVILKPRGIKGEVVASLLLPLPKKKLTELFIGSTTGDSTKYSVETLVPSGNYMVLKFLGINTRDDAEALRSLTIWTERFKLPENVYYINEIKGLEVRTLDGKVLGKLERVIPTPGNDVFVVRNDKKEVLVPALKKVVLEINKETIIVNPGFGLIEATESNED
ncbi:MAG: ribosome maturation factor RimM [Elusimicrobiota bacterium]